MNSVRLFSVITFAVLGAGQVVLPSAVVAQIPAVSQPLLIKPAHQMKLKSSIAPFIAAPRTATPFISKAAVQQKKFTDFTLRSFDTRDLKGVKPSLYRGAYFNPLVEEKRKCIVKRESEGYYEVRGGGGNRYFGAYQMSQELAQGATWMMLPEHKKLMGTSEAKKVFAKLRKTPPNKWPRYFQDAAFSTVHNWESTGSGASHWAGGRWHC